MKADLRKGWCPGALRPMMARDGLLVRLRITGGIVPAATAAAIADLATRYGNGLLDLSARANLQLRGIREDSLPALLDGLATLDLLDIDAESEAVRNVLASPLAGIHAAADEPDIRQTVVELEKALVADPALRALPPKFSLLVDDGGLPSLAGLSADLRFDWVDGAFDIGFGGTITHALPLGRCGLSDAVPRASAILRRLVAAPCGPLRARNFLAAMGREAAFAWLGGEAKASAAGRIAPTMPRDLVGARTIRNIPCLGLAAPFGRLDAAMLRVAAALGEIRLTPWRSLLVPPADPTSLTALAAAGFIVDPADPRLRVAACTGHTGCERGTTDTHADATRLAPLAAALPGEDIALHVSGCAKGCAHPRPAPLTLVGRDGRYDLVRYGRAGDVAMVGDPMNAGTASILRCDDTGKGDVAPHLPSLLWGGAGVGVGPYVSDTGMVCSHTLRDAARHGLTPAPNPSPQGGEE